MKTRFLMSAILMITLIIIVACSKDGIKPQCLHSPEYCIELCAENPENCFDSSLEELQGLKIAKDSARAVSKLPVRD